MQPLKTGNIRLAATVLLLRDTADGIEVFMVQRPGSGDFPDLHVFPGGKVDAEDHAEAICDGLTEVDASQQLGLDAGGLRYWVTAIRECFEEAGVLLANRAGQPVSLSKQELENLETQREQLIRGELSFTDFCIAQELRPACDRVRYFSHWLTPESAPRRFDTRFFVAAMPDGQETEAHNWETADSAWIAPAEALDLYRLGAWQMIDPTIVSLETLTRFGTVAQAFARIDAGGYLPELTDELRFRGMAELR